MAWFKNLDSAERRLGFRWRSTPAGQHHVICHMNRTSFILCSLVFACLAFAHQPVRADEASRYESGFTFVGTGRIAEAPYLRGTGFGGRAENAIAGWWDELSLTEAEDRIVNALQIIAPVRRLGFVVDPRGRERRMAKVSLEGQQRPVPLAVLRSI